LFLVSFSRFLNFTFRQTPQCHLPLEQTERIVRRTFIGENKSFKFNATASISISQGSNGPVASVSIEIRKCFLDGSPTEEESSYTGHAARVEWDGKENFFIIEPLRHFDFWGKDHSDGFVYFRYRQDGSIRVFQYPTDDTPFVVPAD
jgi:hypothetical protein